MRKSITQQNCAHATDEEMSELLKEAKVLPEDSKDMIECMTETNEILCLYKETLCQNTH